MSDKHESNRRYIITGLCGMLILVRMIWPDIKFDEISVFLFVFGGLTFLFPTPVIMKIMSAIKKIKTPGFELEFKKQIEALANEADKIEKEVETSPTDSFTFEDSWIGVKQDISRFLAHPREGLIEIAVRIESAASDLAEYYRIPRAHSLVSPVMVASELAKRELLPKETPELIRGFWSVRNQAVHAKDFEITQEHLYELLDLGIRILRLLSLRRSYVEFARRQVKSNDAADIIVGANILSQRGESEDILLLRETLKQKGLSGESKEALERALENLEEKRKAQ